MSNDNQIDAFLARINLPKVTDEQNNKLISKITKEELQSAIRRMKGGGGSPGTLQHRMVQNNDRSTNPNIIKNIELGSSSKPVK